MVSKNRILWIDVAKGICMLSVIAGHLGVSKINNIVFSYHLTVFFILSGYTLKNNLSKETLSRKFSSLMTPYFITCIAVTVMDVFKKIILKGTADFAAITQVLGYDLLRSFLASGSIKTFGTIEIGGRIGAVWYLPATFFAVLITQFLLKYIEDRKIRYGIAIPMALLSSVSAKFIWLPFSVQSAFLATPLILLGYDWKQNGKLLKLSAKDVLMCSIIFGVGAWAKKTPVYYVTASMPDYILSTICALASSICVIWLAQKLAGSKILGWIGRNSLYYLCIHLFEMETMSGCFKMLLEGMRVPVNALTRFVVKLLFITAVTMLILLCKKLWSPKKEDALVLQTKQDPALDAAKAILIILMIIGYFSVGKQFRSIIYSFHMVAFVFYSGYCFRSETCQNLYLTIRKDIKHFLIPYALFGAGYIFLTHDGIWMEMKRLIYGISFTKNLFTDVASIGAVYFILLLFVTKVIYLYIERYVPGEKWKALSVLGISVLGMYLGKKGYWLPWSADCSMYALIFYYLGHCFKKYRIMEYICERNYFYFILSSIWAYMIYKGSMEIAIRNYGSYGLVIFGAVSATVLVYMACRYLCRVLDRRLMALICQVGKNTLYILIVHKLLAGYIAKAVSLVFTKESIFYVTAMVFIQLLSGVIIGSLVAWLQKSFPPGNCA